MDKLILKIKEILKAENYTFAQLASYLNLTEQELSDGLINKTLELRYLEDISKTLKVPLYSFFRSTDYTADAKHEKPFYINKLWDDENTPQSLEEEIDLLKKAIAHKENELNKKNTKP